MVSIKSGTDEDATDIVIELLSRLPYQAGLIYGLQINARQATLCSVQFVDQSEDSLQRVDVFIYRYYIFKKYEKSFDMFDEASFWRMVLDIIHYKTLGEKNGADHLLGHNFTHHLNSHSSTKFSTI